jgi:NADH dehydrogenase
MNNIFVLGGTGFVGAHVCEKLVRAGWHVTVPTRKRINAKGIMHLPGLTVLEMNVHDEQALARELAGHEAVVNLVAILHGNEAAFDKTHVALTAKLARASASAGINQLVHISALGADEKHPDAPPSRYLRSKSRGEALLLRPAGAPWPFDVTVLRPSVIFGAQDKFLNLFAKLQRIFPLMPLAGANAKFQPVWVQDVANAVVHSLRYSGSHQPANVAAAHIFELCGPEVFTLAQLVHNAGVWAGVNEGRGRPVLPLPDWAGRVQALAMECAPGAPLMSRDNLDSMKTANIATGTHLGLAALGIHAAALEPIARAYLNKGTLTQGMLETRQHHGS